MIEQLHRGAHWRGTLRIALVVVACLVALITLSSLFIGLFTDWRFLGFPFAFYIVAQGGFVIMIALVFWSAGQQERVDRKHGAAEEI
jgi:putative solute:sodium symporter small subunit